MGAWLLYGLGTENQDLPGFIVLGFQENKENVQMVYSIKEMQPKAVLKGLTHMVDDLVGKI